MHVNAEGVAFPCYSFEDRMDLCACGARDRAKIVVGQRSASGTCWYHCWYRQSVISKPPRLFTSDQRSHLFAHVHRSAETSTKSRISRIDDVAVDRTRLWEARGQASSEGRRQVPVSLQRRRNRSTRRGEGRRVALKSDRDPLVARGICDQWALLQFTFQA
jgi:hypothetical protein